MEKIKIKIGWIHNFSTDINVATGIFMFQQFDYLKTKQEIDIELINIGSLKNPVNFLLKYFRYQKNFKSLDILHAQYGSGLGFFVSLFPQKKILSLRGSDWYKSPSINLKGKLHIWLGNLLTNLSIDRYNKIIVMSERMKTEVKIKHPKSNPIVIPDGIDLKIFFPENKKKNKKFRVLFSTINENNPIKRKKLAQDSFLLFHKKYPNSEMVYMSGIPHNMVRPFINSCDVILLTSTHEGWPNIIKEGLACNVPFVSTNVSDLKIFVEKLENCYVCNANEAELAIALERIYLQRDKNLNFRDISEEFDINHTNKKLMQLYTK